MSADTGHWIAAEGVLVCDEMFGFVYEITCTINNKKYIGRKQCVKKIKRSPLKGKTRKRIEYTCSDWRTYTGSSTELNKDIELYGKDKFIFSILRVCNSKAALAYYETKTQFERDALLSEDYYNGIINCRLPKFKDV